MKKIIVMLLMAVAFCGSAEAQKGMMGVGVNGGIGLELESGDAVRPGVGVKFQYNITNFIRLEPSFSYYFGNDEGLDYAGLVNAHIFFMNPRRVRPYFLAGIGYSSTRRWAHYYSMYSYGTRESSGGFAFDAGLGLDWRLSHRISLQIEAGALKQTGFEGFERGLSMKANIGVAFNF